MFSSVFSWLVGQALAATAGGGTLPSGTVDPSAQSGVQDLANRVLDTLTFLAYPLAFAAIVYTAYVLISSAGNPDGWAKAKKNLTYLTIGVFLIVFAGILVRFAVSLFTTSTT